MDSQSPKFSIIIPTYNRPERLEHCLTSIVQLDYPYDRFEIIVVDDGSQMSLNPIIEKFESRLSLSLIQQRNAGPASARNTGAAAAQGQYLVFTDDDCQPNPDWLNALAAAFADFPNALIGGNTVNALPHNLCSTASQLLIDYLYGYFNQMRGKATFFCSNNFSAPRDRYQQLGGFDTSFPLAAGEDREFCDRWLQAGYSMHYAPAAQIHHAHKLTLRSFWRQHFNYGRGAFHFHQVRAKRGAGKIAVEPLSFYSNLLIYPFSQSSNTLRLFLPGLFVLSQVANLTGFFWERFNQKAKLKQPKSQAIKDVS